MVGISDGMGCCSKLGLVVGIISLFRAQFTSPLPPQPCKKGGGIGIGIGEKDVWPALTWYFAANKANKIDAI